MANPTARNVVAGKPLVTGGMLVAPSGTALPTDATATLVPDYTALGYIGEDGLTETNERTTDKIKAWGGDTVKVVQTDFSVTYAATLLETLNADVLKAVYGPSYVTTTPATATAGTLHAVKVQGEQLPRQVFVFEVKDGNARIRIVVPDGQITEVGEITYSDADVIGYAVTVEAFYDPTAQANAIKYLDDGVFASV